MSENINTNKEGEWIYKHWCYFECSKCGFGRDKYKQESLYPYCPMCGVKMKQYENNKQIHGFIQEVINIDVLKFLVTRPDDTVLVYLMKNEFDNTYSFVNITRWHICPCRFQSIRDAVADMDRLKEEGKIIRYEFTN